MANKTLFQSASGKLLPSTDTVNEAGGRAYRLESRHALAQYAATGCLNTTFYASDRQQLDNVLALCREVEPLFVAKTAIYARQRGFMKDLPALLTSVLASRDGELLARIFPRVIDRPKMLRNFVQIVRSGVTGRKSLGSRPRRLVRQWLESRSDERLFTASVGQSPSLADIVKMVHPKPKTTSREALLGYLIGREVDAGALPQVVRDFESFKQSPAEAKVPDVPFQMLTALALESRHWVEIARRAPWQMTRMNLNTFLRHGVFEHDGLDRIIADRLRDPSQVRRARVFPYQLFAAWQSASEALPRTVRRALGTAMEIALANVPEVAGKVYVLPDISGSMHSPVTGYRRGSSSAVRCIDVAALVAAAVLRKNPRAKVIPFSDDVVKAKLNPSDPVMVNAKKLASLPSGGTNCSAPLAFLNRKQARGDLVIYVSDNESWVDSQWGGRGTATLAEWTRFKHRNREARMACIDIQPYAHTQAKERRDILNIGGFSDQVFRLLADFARGGTDAGYWVRQIEEIEIEAAA
ncbi:MAG: RNA-binding protein [Acidobacteriota bacterium]